MLLSMLLALAPQGPVGINLETVTDWHQQTPFVDAFKSSREWISHQASPFSWGTGPTVITDELGWPQSLQSNQWIESIIFSNGSPNYPDGIYNIRYDGVGTVQPLAGGNGSVTIVQQTQGHIKINLQVPSDGYFTLRITDIVQPIENIRVYLPGYDNSQRIFHPDFMKSLEPFDTIRFMNWGRTNDNPVINWYDATNFYNYTQATSEGVHPLYMIDLCNKTCKNMWICVPHMANDLYVQYLALLCRIALDPSLTIYLEYSNEVWNGIFDQNTYAQNEGMALGLNPQPWHAGWLFYSQRSVEVFNLFSNMYNQLNDRRLVRVLAGQSVNPWINRQIMDWQNAYESADAFAVAPYFGGGFGNLNNVPLAPTFSIPYLLTLCQANIVNNHHVFTRQNKIDTNQRGLRLLAYEGGQHLVGVGAAQNNQTLTNLFVAANRDPGMRQLYYIDLDEWFSEGADLFMLYRLTGDFGRYGSFGLLEWQTQHKSTAPKWLGVMDYLGR
tara:strand:+ start:1216 stop:2709 length:1494 start_codon:yes stop_codon:yes gene_type:complete